jgi:undecaprenyl diphosphate synthase
MLATEAAGGLLDPEDITEDLLGEHLASRTLPADLREPDLLVRPGGER